MDEERWMDWSMAVVGLPRGRDKPHHAVHGVVCRVMSYRVCLSLLSVLGCLAARSVGSARGPSVRMPLLDYLLLLVPPPWTTIRCIHGGVSGEH